MAKGKDYKNALQEAGPQGGSSHLIVPRKLHCPGKIMEESLGSPFGEMEIPAMAPKWRAK